MFAVQWSKKKDGPPWAVLRGKNDAARGDENRDLLILIVRSANCQARRAVRFAAYFCGG